ncbi:hypothetical protein [Parvibaculum sp.]|uniref:hypothetical protein n=1 Tax=Parvibaculum sp. TaxID=2024848 RepID=UPI003BA94F96
MEAFLELSWRLYPATGLALAGALLVVRGVRAFLRARRHARDPERALLVARSFRVAIMGLCFGVFAAAWIAQLGWLLAISLIVLGEEMLETSVMVAALRDGARRERAASCAICARARALRATT